jgi:hypothetical protein
MRFMIFKVFKMHRDLMIAQHEKVRRELKQVNHQRILCFEKYLDVFLSSFVRSN